MKLQGPHHCRFKSARFPLGPAAGLTLKPPDIVMYNKISPSIGRYYDKLSPRGQYNT